MSRKIFVNLPVADLDRAKAFYEALGFAANPQFTNHLAACIVVSENIYVMLLTHDFFRTFIPSRTIADAKTTTEALLCISCESRDEVDALVKKALAAGGTVINPPQDHGMMYGHNFADLDGHIWEPMWMDASAIQKAD